MMKKPSDMKTGKNIGVIVQARMTSQRLPGKVLIRILGKPIIEHVYERLRMCRNISDIILAMPDTRESDPLEEQAKSMDCHFYRGDEHDVLSRYYHAAKAFGVDTIIRITGDCPLVDPKVIDRLVKDFLERGTYDYMVVDSEGGFPRGIDSEIFGFETLEKVHREARLEYEREHVTPYIYQHLDLFRVLFIEAQGKLRRPELRLTVDTEEDLLLIKEIFSRLKDYEKNFSTEDVIAIIDNNPHLQLINRHIIQKDIHSS